MKTLLFLLCFSFNTAFCQQVVVANEKMNIVYMGVENPLSAAVAGYPCQSVILTTDNGKIQKAECGRFIYNPQKVGVAKINVWVKNGKTLKKVNEWMYRAKLLPDPIASIGANTGGTIHKTILIKMGGVIARLMNSDFEAPFQVWSYTVSAVRNCQNIFSLSNIGSQYNEEVKKNLEALTTGDHLLISNIKCIGPDGTERVLTPLEFIITE